MIIGGSVTCGGLADVSTIRGIKHVLDLTNELKQPRCAPFLSSPVCFRSVVHAARSHGQPLQVDCGRIRRRAESSQVSQTGFRMLSQRAALPGSHGADEPRGVTCLWQIRSDLQAPEKCRVHQLNMCAFVNSAQSWHL